LSTAEFAEFQQISFNQGTRAGAWGHGIRLNVSHSPDLAEIETDEHR
jgi:hypothetical protein